MSANAPEDAPAACPGPAPAEAQATAVAARAVHMMGRRTQSAWHAQEAMAWEGLLEVARRLRRAAEELLLERFELSISMLGVIGRLALADERTLRLTQLAQAMGLSLSRVSRVIDLLEQRGLLERRTCPSDARATNVMLTDRGSELTERAQRELFAFVQDAFVELLEPEETSTLAAVFTRIIDA